MMDVQQVRLVQDTFRRLVPRADVFAQRFYENLFILDPQLRNLFPASLQVQHHKLMVMISAAVEALEDPTTLLDELHALGRRHVAYQVTPQYYTTVGAAMMLTLQEALGPGFTAEVELAWLEVYGLLMTTMLEGANL